MTSGRHPILGFGPVQGVLVGGEIGPALGGHRRGQEFRIDVGGFFAKEGDFPDYVGQELRAGVSEGAEDVALVQPLAHQVVFQPHVGHRRGLGPGRRRPSREKPRRQEQDPRRHPGKTASEPCPPPTLESCANATFFPL